MIRLLLTIVVAFAGWNSSVRGGEPTRRNNLVTELLKVGNVAAPSTTYSFRREREGWIFLSAAFAGQGKARLLLDSAASEPVLAHEGTITSTSEGVRYVARGEHKLYVECAPGVTVQNLVVRAIPELIHSGLGFNSAIKGYGIYDLAFLKKDVLPNITTLVVPQNIALKPAEIDGWHRQGKRFIAEVGIDTKAATADEHVKYWTGFLDKAPFLDGLIVNEFIVNQPVAEWAALTPERLQRMEKERQRYLAYGEAIEKMHGLEKYGNKMFYAYVGGSGRKLNQEIIGPKFIKTIVASNYRVALERYVHERSSEQKSKAALQALVDEISDWETKQPGVKNHLVVAFGLFSMPPGGINKQPNVDYHVWMDQQMNVLASNPQLAGVEGVEWWTTSLADEETVRFAGKLYRHYGIEGRTDMLTRDPLFLTHIQNADFELGTKVWGLKPATAASIQAKSFPRYGRIEGRYMGLGRPADPEHIGDTFLWMQRNEKGPNTFSQRIENLEPGRLYSMKMFTCDYQDLMKPRRKKLEEANKFIGTVTLEGVELDEKRSFTEQYSSNPEPTIPVWITYHWKVFRARERSATLTVSDWAEKPLAGQPFGQEQIFNFLEIQPYHD